MIDLLTNEMTIRGANAEYAIVNLIGRGGMGAVYRARRIDDNTIWALKEMRAQEDSPPAEREENRKLFLQEAELLSKLSHPNLPVLADFFEYKGRPVLVMEFVPGKTLEDMLHDANAPMLEQDVLRYGIQAARVLHYLHTRTPPIIYRDLKPSNLMRTPDGVLKIIDFGVARTYKARKSKDTVAMGSAGYAPPEQYGKGQTDARSDLYALAATLLHLLTNLPPIPLQTPPDGSIRKLNPSVDQKTEKILIKAMALDPAARYRDMAEFERALLGRLNGSYVDPTKNAPAPPPVVPPRAVTSATQRQHEPPAAPVTVQPAAPPPAAPPVAPRLNGTPCPRCGRVNKRGARFCAGCGLPLSAGAQPRLQITTPRGTWEQKIDGQLLRIGRRDPRRNHFPELDLAEHDRGIASRNHAAIRRDGETFSLIDLGSTNGTLLNGALIPANTPRPLRPGDKIKIGEVEIEFRY